VMVQGQARGIIFVRPISTNKSGVLAQDCYRELHRQHREEGHCPG
jgi:hypothetical protein